MATIGGGSSGGGGGGGAKLMVPFNVLPIVCVWGAVWLLLLHTGINTLDLGKFKFEKELKNHNIGSHRYSIANEGTKRHAKLTVHRIIISGTEYFSITHENISLLIQHQHHFIYVHFQL